MPCNVKGWIQFYADFHLKRSSTGTVHKLHLQTIKPVWNSGPALDQIWANVCSGDLTRPVNHDLVIGIIHLPGANDYFYIIIMSAGAPPQWAAERVTRGNTAGTWALAVSSTARPCIDAFALPEKFIIAVTESDHDPKVQKMSITF